MDYNPSLSSILATLSAYAPPAQQPPPPTPYQTLQPPAQPPPIHSPHQTFAQAPARIEEAYHPPQPTTTTTPHPAPSPTPQTLSSTPQPPLPPASSITTWPPALRHSLALSQDEEKMHRLRHLIQEQHAHERAWWRGREELVRKQRGRGEARGKLDGVLKGLGGHVAASTHLSDPEADTRELERYDKKVHVACGEMIAATERELKVLGVPFFGVGEGLIRRDGGGVREKDEGGIGEKELQGLRKRMLELLEDLCKD